MKRPAKKHTYDDTLLVTVLILVLVGLILLTSTSAYNGRVKFHDSYYYLKKQGLATVLGMAGMLWIARIDYHRWIPLAVPGYLAAIGLSIAVMAFGKEYNGSKRWLSLGPFSFQPSEFAKVAVILFLAWLINRNVKKISKLRIMSGMMLSILPVVGLVGASNLSTAIIILGIAVTLIFVASPRYAQFIWMAVSGVGFLGIFLALESYRLERLAIWRNPEKYEKGYQTLQGLYAIGSGGLFGRGLGNSVQKLGFLPGDLSQKVDPYLRPLYDALFEMLGFEKVEKLIERNVIEVAPLAYMRGRTLNDAFIILDESQNTTIEQMKMFLTRIGFNSKAVITGDVTQIDLPRNTKSGLRHAIEVLADVEEISFNFFHSEDVVRHPVVARIVNAYEAWEEAEQKRKAALAAERKREEQEQK